jgi:uncharacterized RDD family membrane protein YckC
METGLDLSVEMEAQPVHRTISGFWTRLVAIVLDSLILGIVGFVSGLFFFNLYAQLGGWGHLIGFGVDSIYFGTLNSAIGKGQTIGKRIMKIEVTDKSGEHIALGRSLLRNTILGVPFFLNGVLLPPSVVMSPIGYVIGFIVFGIGGAIIYLYIFNRRTRQSLHDLGVGTFVTKTSPKGSVRSISVWNLHLAVVGVWFIAVVGLLAFMPALSQKGVFPELVAVQKSIQSSGKVHVATAIVGKSWGMTSGKKWESTYFQTNAIWKERPGDYGAAAREIAAIVLKNYPEVMKKDVLTITVTYGYDIGIARSWRSQTVQHSPQEWQEILRKSGLDEG